MIIISIHALREEGDDLPGVLPDEDKKFLSTPSARRATDVLELRTSELKNFYPRPPRGGRRCGQEKQAVGGVISIHALREEGDPTESNH